MDDSRALSEVPIEEVHSLYAVVMKLLEEIKVVRLNLSYFVFLVSCPTTGTA
jgi:hypothetical protein